MADLRGKEIKDEYANLLTKGPNGEVQDGEGNDINRLTARLHAPPAIEIDDDGFGLISSHLPLNGLIILVFNRGSDQATCIYSYNRTASTPTILVDSSAGAIFAGATGVPDGTTGADGKLTIFVDQVGRNLYIENRMGIGTRTFSIYLFGSTTN